MNDNQASEKALVCMRCVVAGRVQGVFYRATTRNQAQGLGLKGYARNLPDGTVEVMVCGDAPIVSELTDWLRKGPPGARVTGVSCETLPFQEFHGFTTR
jgi:acylphosphatase